MTGLNLTVLGVLVLARHGDRQGFYQSSDTYAASDMSITPLGEVSEFHWPCRGQWRSMGRARRKNLNLGDLLCSLYFNVNLTSYIQGISLSTAAVNNAQALHPVADASNEGVIYISAVAPSQELAFGRLSICDQLIHPPVFSTCALLANPRIRRIAILG